MVAVVRMMGEATEFAASPTAGANAFTSGSSATCRRVVPAPMAMHSPSSRT